MGWQSARGLAERDHVGSREAIRSFDVLVLRVPSTEAEVKSADASPMAIDYHDLLVMRPEFDIIWTTPASIRERIAGGH